MKYETPGVVFTMRYPNDIGFVWKTIFTSREMVAKRLTGVARSFVAFPQILENGIYSSDKLEFIEADFYDSSYENKEKLKKILVEFGIKVIVFMSASPSLIDVTYFNKLGVSTVNTENDSFDQNERQSYFRSLGKYLIRTVFRMNVHSLHIANSLNQKKFLENFGRYPKDRLEVVVNGVDINKYVAGDREKACHELGLSSNYFWVLAASQSRSEKRIEKIIEVARDIYNENSDSRVRFLYIGDGVKLEEWRSIANRYSLSERFFFLGQKVSLVTAYQAASVFIHAAEKESFGLVIAEAMACGCPVIACEAAGPVEILSESNGGVIVGLNDFVAFKNAILFYEENENIRKMHGIFARNHVEKRFSIFRQADEFANLLKRFF